VTAKSPARALSLSHPDGRRAFHAGVRRGSSTFPAFTFTDLRSTFEELFALLTSLLRASVREACVAVPMDVREGLHVGNLSDERIVKCSQFVLAAHAPGISEEQLARDLPGRAKIASWQQLPFLLRSARAASDCRSPTARRRGSAATHVAYFIIDVAGGPSTGATSRRAQPRHLSAATYDPAQLKLEIFAIPAKA